MGRRQARRIPPPTLLNGVGGPYFNAPNDLLGDIADWLIQYGQTCVVNGCMVLKYDNASEAGTDGFKKTVKASSAAAQALARSNAERQGRSDMKQKADNIIERHDAPDILNRQQGRWLRHGTTR